MGLGCEIPKAKREKEPSRRSSVTKVASRLLQEKRDLNEFQILRLFEKHPILHINFHIDAPVFLLPNEPPLQVEVGSLDVTSLDGPPRSLSNVDSFYDKFTLVLANFAIKLGDDYICKPLSTRIEVYQSFIQRSSIEMTKLFFEMSELDLRLKKSQFQSLLKAIDSFSTLSAPQALKIDAIRAAALADVEIPSSARELPKSLSVMFQLLFKQFHFSLLKEDDSLHTSFDLSGLEIRTKLIQTNVELSVDVNRLVAVSGQERMIDFELTNGRSISLSYGYSQSSHSIDLVSAKPLIIVDFRWIRDVHNFFDIEQQETQTVPEPGHAGEVAQIHLVDKKSSAKRRTERKIQANVTITDPLFSLILVGKQAPITMSFGLTLVKVNIGENQQGQIDLEKMTLRIDNRDLV
jgi:hypothetical protein